MTAWERIQGLTAMAGLGLFFLILLACIFIIVINIF